MSTALAVREESAFELGKVFAESGMFPNTRKASEAIVKIIAGREFGLGPMAAMNGIHMVDGKPTLAANLIAGQIKRSPKYDYKVIRREATGCTLEFFELRDHQRVPLGRMTWDKKDADAAGLSGKQNWKKYPRDMYFARCLTAGARTFCPDVLGGSPIYTAEELGADEQQPAHALPLVPMGRESAEHDPEEGIADAEVVSESNAEILSETVNEDSLKHLREVYIASGKDQDELCWCLLSVGVESLPESPTDKDVGNAMRSLTVAQALKLEPLLTGEDDSVPGSGESS